MEIKIADLKWKGKFRTLYLAQIKYIMIHHTAHPTWDIYDTHNYHQIERGWIGIGYNFFINPDGTVFEGRGLTNVGAGATGYNFNSLHVCFAGNFEKNEPTATQIKNGKELLTYLLTIVPKNVEIIGHKDIGATACPGKYFPLEEFKNIKQEMEEYEMRYQTIEEVPEYAKATIQKLIQKGILKGNEKGLDLTEEMIRIFVILDRAGSF